MECSASAELWLRIISASGANPCILKKLSLEFGTQELLEILSDRLGRERLSRKLGRVIGEPRQEFVSDQLRRMERSSSSVVCIEDDHYPDILREIYDAPPVLFFRGTMSRLRDSGVCVVGTRRPTRRGVYVASSISRNLSRMGIHVVSGLARGIDAAAHEGALEYHGGTSAVLGCGVDVIYPPEHAELAGRITEQGCLISECPLGTPPLRHHFPMRNRILSGLSLAVVVVEAGSKSGALGTASWAVQQNREVLAVPGPVDSRLSIGPNELIRKGAGLVTCAEHVVEAVPSLARKIGTSNITIPKQESFSFDVRQREVLEALELEPKHIDEIARICNSTSTVLMPVLLDLEIKGTVISTGDGTYALARPLFPEIGLEDNE